MGIIFFLWYRYADEYSEFECKTIIRFEDLCKGVTYMYYCVDVPSRNYLHEDLHTLSGECRIIKKTSIQGCIYITQLAEYQYNTYYT